MRLTDQAPEELAALFAAVGDVQRFGATARRFVASNRRPARRSADARELLRVAVAAHLQIVYAALDADTLEDVLAVVGLTTLHVRSDGVVLRGLPARFWPDVNVDAAGAIVTDTVEATAALRQAIHAAATSRDTHVVAPFQLGARAAVVEFRWCDSSECVFLAIAPTQTPHASAMLARTFRLSPRETRLVDALAAGTTLAGWASDNQLALSTAKSHLRSIFRKAGVHSQSELLRLVCGTAHHSGTAGV
jgi:DNA-binding CsgD family transcriptional regulator